MAKKIEFTNVTVGVMGSRASVCWVSRGARFHYWTGSGDPDLMPVDDTLYKNPLRVDAKRYDPDWFKTRRLSLTVPSNYSIAHRVRRHAIEQNLLAAGREEEAREEAERIARQTAEFRADAIKRIRGLAAQLNAPLDSLDDGQIITLIKSAQPVMALVGMIAGMAPYSEEGGEGSEFDATLTMNAMISKARAIVQGEGQS